MPACWRLLVGALLASPANRRQINYIWSLVVDAIWSLWQSYVVSLISWNFCLGGTRDGLFGRAASTLGSVNRNPPRNQDSNLDLCGLQETYQRSREDRDYIRPPHGVKPPHIGRTKRCVVSPTRRPFNVGHPLGVKSDQHATRRIATCVPLGTHDTTSYRNSESSRTSVSARSSADSRSD